ncbi:MAG: hypothetical protein U0Q18_06075 [Bryobacteraceae bacterium]
MRRIVQFLFAGALVVWKAGAQVNIAPVGAAGNTGTSLLSGSSAPPANIGSNGDFYLDTAASCLYGPKASGIWLAVCIPLRASYISENTANKGKPGGYAALDDSGLLPASNLPSSTVTASTISNGSLPARLESLSVTGDSGLTGNLTVGGTIKAITESGAPGCYHLTDTNAVHDTALCAPANGFNGTVRVWGAAGATGQAATTDGNGSLQWSNLGGISGSLVSGQFPAQFGLNGNWFLNWTPTAASSGSPNVLSVTAPAHTTLDAAEVNDLYWNGMRTVQITGGTTLPLQRSILFTPPAYSFTSPTTIAAAATLATSGAPSAGTNATIASSYGLWAQSGALSGSVTSAYGLRADSPTGAVNNYAAYLNGSTAIGPSAAAGAAANATLTVFNGTGSGNTTAVIKAATSTPSGALLKVVDSAGTAQIQVDSGFHLAIVGSAGQHIKTAQQTTDIAGTVQLSAGTASVAFAAAYNSIPVCVANSRNSAAAIKVVPGVSGVTFNSSSGSDTSVVNYICIGNPN